LVRHPELTKAFLPYNVHVLFGSTLTPRQREIAILRVAALADSPYEVEHHTGMARAVGMTDEQISDALGGIATADEEQLILRAVNELHTTSTISDSTWNALSVHMDERQLMDLVFTVGAYTTLAMAFNTFGVEPDRELQPEYER
jgi:AhpD family alkylhydroperoxidase